MVNVAKCPSSPLSVYPNANRSSDNCMVSEESPALAPESTTNESRTSSPAVAPSASKVTTNGNMAKILSKKIFRNPRLPI